MYNNKILTRPHSDQVQEKGREIICKRGRKRPKLSRASKNKILTYCTTEISLPDARVGKIFVLTTLTRRADRGAPRINDYPLDRDLMGR